MVPGGFLLFFMVLGWFLLVTGCFFHGYSWFRLVFHGSRLVVMVFHGFRSFFMVFHGSGWFFMVPDWCFIFNVENILKLYSGPTIQSRPSDNDHDLLGKCLSTQKSM